jgi:hypothetical protein
MDGIQGLHPSVDLIIVEIPNNMIVPGLGNQPPAWNRLSVDYKKWYGIVLDFALKYL